MFVVKQVVEKAIKYNNQHTCIVDLTKAFDKIKLDSAMNEFDGRRIPPSIMEMVRELTHQNKINNNRSKAQGCDKDRVSVYCLLNTH